MLPRAAFAIFLAAVCRASAQEALTDALPAPPAAIARPLPSSAWLDLRQTTSRNSKTQEAPAWVEALTLLPGDLIMTGTPSGVGPIKAGDELEARIGDWAPLRNRVADAPGAKK